MKKRLYEWIFMRLMGWKIRGSMDPQIKKCVIIIVPHTSWYDFVIGLLARGIIDLEMHYVAKKELFRFPFGWYFRWMGGTPLDRSGGQHKVDAIAALFKERSVFRVAIAPEGTRKKVTSLKSGFYYIALKAGVPIVPVSFDYVTKTVLLGTAFYPSGNFEDDLSLITQYFKGVTGKIPEYGFDVN